MRYTATALVAMGLGMFSFATSATAQTITVKRGASADLGGVYWVSGCSSKLDDFEGIRITNGAPGLSVSLRKEDVKPTRQGCDKLIPGAMVVVTVSPDAPLGNSTIEYRVNYRTQTGGKEQSNHTRNLVIVQ